MEFDTLILGCLDLANDTLGIPAGINVSPSSVISSIMDV